MKTALKVRVIGFGMGPHHLTAEAVEAIRSCDYIVAAKKSTDDRLLAVRQQIADDQHIPLLAVADPERDRDPANYDQAVDRWHDARVRAYAEVLAERGGTAGFLVWGDPSLYDSTIRIVERLAAQLPLDYDVLPSVSAPSLLAARHRIVLHPVGRPLHITTARRLREDIATGQQNVCVMLGGDLALAGFEDWSIWWGANLGAASEELAAGRVGDVIADIAAARAKAAERAGWVMDCYLLRAP